MFQRISAEDGSNINKDFSKKSVMKNFGERIKTKSDADRYYADLKKQQEWQKREYLKFMKEQAKTGQLEKSSRNVK